MATWGEARANSRTLCSPTQFLGTRTIHSKPHWPRNFQLTHVALISGKLTSEDAFVGAHRRVRGNHESTGAWYFGQQGHRRDIEDLAAVVEYLQSEEMGYKVVLIMGHSKGSSVGMHWMAVDPVGRTVPAFVNISARYRMAVSFRNIMYEALQLTCLTESWCGLHPMPRAALLPEDDRY